MAIDDECQEVISSVKLRTCFHLRQCEVHVKPNGLEIFTIQLYVAENLLT